MLAWVMNLGFAAGFDATPDPSPTVDHAARAKLLLMLRKKKRIKQRQEVKDGR